MTVGSHSSIRVLLTADPEIPVPPEGYGGIERIVDALVRYYRSIGHTVGLVAHRESLSPANSLFAWPSRTSRGQLRSARNALALRRAVRAFRPDIVHSFSRLAYLLPILRSELPKVMSYQRHTGGRQITWATRFAGDSLAFTGCSEFICRMGGASGGSWQAIPNFVETERIAFTVATEADAPLVFLSRVEAIKGPEMAIAIAQRARRKLVIAGNHATAGSERAFWERAIVPRLGRDGIAYVGEVGDQAKGRLLGSAAALLVPVQWDEPFGIVFAEALAAGTPVISCPRGALPEIVDHGRTGFLVRSVEEGSAAVARLAEIDRAECRRVAVQRFDVRICATQYLELYDNLRRRKQAPAS